MLTKRLYLVLGSITLVIGCSFFLTGKLIQKSYYDTVAKLNEQGAFKVNLLSYKRGLVGSEAKLELELVANNPRDTRVIPLQQKITHGPVFLAQTLRGSTIKVAAAQITTILDEPWQQLLVGYSGNKQPLVVNSVIDFKKQVNTWVKLAAIDQTTDSKFHVAWDKMEGEIKHDLSFSNYEGGINLAKLVMDNPNWNFKVQDLSLQLNAKEDKATFASNNIFSAKVISYTKGDIELVKIEDLTTNLEFSNPDGNLALVMLTSVARAHVVNQQFAQETFKIQANNLNRDSLRNLPRWSRLTPKATLDFTQQLTFYSTELDVEMPKHFTEALLAYISFELYRSSILGKLDQRPEQVVLKDVTSSINNLVQGAVKQQLFIDRGAHYALNINRNQQ